METEDVYGREVAKTDADLVRRLADLLLSDLPEHDRGPAMQKEAAACADGVLGVFRFERKQR